MVVLLLNYWIYSCIAMSWVNFQFSLFGYYPNVTLVDFQVNFQFLLSEPESLSSSEPESLSPK